jgi:hypothetical protein
MFDTMRFIMAVVLMAGLSLFVESCNKSENQDENPDNEKVQFTPTPNRPNRASVQQLLAIAVDKSFENNVNKQPSTKSSVSETNLSHLFAETDNPILHISYPYDYIKIYDVMKFSCAGVDSPIVQTICGDGEIEVYLASFGLFKETEIEEEQKKPDVKSLYGDEDVLKNIVFGEPMIVFKSDLGIYSCIANSSGVIDSKDISAGFYIEFSSHKYLSEKALEKNFIFPLYQFFVTAEDNKITLKTTYIEEDVDATVIATGIPLNNQQTVSSEELFSLVELSNIPEVSALCEVTGLADNYFIVKTNESSNLEQVYFDEYSEFFIDDTSTTSDNIAVGDVITVTYNKLYESYNPKSVVANKIMR